MPVPERRGVTRVRFARRWAASALVVAMASLPASLGGQRKPVVAHAGSSARSWSPMESRSGCGALLAASGDAEVAGIDGLRGVGMACRLPRRDLRRRARAAVRPRHRRRPHRGSLHRNLGGTGARALADLPGLVGVIGTTCSASAAAAADALSADGVSSSRPRTQIRPSPTPRPTRTSTCGSPSTPPSKGAPRPTSRPERSTRRRRPRSARVTTRREGLPTRSGPASRRGRTEWWSRRRSWRARWR